MRTLRGLALLLTLVALAGCGGDDGGASQASSASGKQVFIEARCGECHTLADAGAKGTIGPDLDRLAPTAESVAEQVEFGGNGMPAFGDELSEAEIDAVAEYVDGAAEAGGPVGVTFEPDDTKVADCEGEEDLPCFEQAFANLVYEEGPRPALATLEKAMSRDEAVALGCHRIAHMSGSAALKRYDDDVGKAFSEGTAVCSSGYYHGILERAFSGVEDDQLSATAKELCATPSIADDGFLRFQCAHGLGHGLMIHTRYELPGSLDVCEDLDDPSDVYSCSNGAFMENFSSSYGFVSGYLRDDDLIYPCNDVPEARKASCYIIVTARILPELDYDWRKAADTCREAEPDWVYMCFRSYGRDAISMNAYRQDQAHRLCRNAAEWESDCVLSVALHIANEERALGGAARFCSDTGPTLRAACYAGVGTTAALLIPDTKARRDACGRLTADRREQFACVTGQVV